MYCIFQVTSVFQPASFDEEFDPEGSNAGGLTRLIVHKHMHLMWWRTEREQPGLAEVLVEA